MTPFGLSVGVAWMWLILLPLGGRLVLQSRFFLPYLWNAAGSDRYFLILSAGFVLAFFGGFLSCIISVCAMFWPESGLAFADFWRFPLDEKTETVSAQLIKLALFWSAPFAFIVGALVFCAEHFFGKQENKRMRTEFLADKNGMLDFVLQASADNSLALLTLSNRKVYVGWPRHVSDWDNPDPSKQYVYFRPLMSGFRKKETLEMEITTDYVEPHLFLSEKNPETEETEFEILIPVHEIVHAQPFDADLYAEHENLFSLSAPA